MQSFLGLGSVLLVTLVLLTYLQQHITGHYYMSGYYTPEDTTTFIRWFNVLVTALLEWVSEYALGSTSLYHFRQCVGKLLYTLL